MQRLVILESPWGRMFVTSQLRRCTVLWQLLTIENRELSRTHIWEFVSTQKANDRRDHYAATGKEESCDLTL